MDFKEFTHNMAHGAIVHMLMQLRSHDPSVDLQWVATGYAQGTNTEKITRLEDNSEELAKRVVEDVELLRGRAVLHRLGKTHVGYLAFFVEHL